MAKRDQFTRTWITDNAEKICARYDYGVLTLRGLHYQLVGLGMTNSQQHYKRVVAAMGVARRNGTIPYEQFSDHDREAIGTTYFEDTSLEDSIETAKRQIKNWIENFYRTRWERQPMIPEVWIEKKALQGTFRPVTSEYGVALCPCKGHPSLTFLNEAAKRFEEVQSNGQTPIILYLGDYDATGEDIPRSIRENLLNDFGCNVEVRRVGLFESQVTDMGLPIAPTKKTDSRAAKWDGLGQVELDAVPPEVLQQWVKDALDNVFDDDIYKQLRTDTANDEKEYRKTLKAYVNEDLAGDLSDEEE